MWIPESVQQFEELVRREALEETNILDFKQEISQKSKDIAVDIAAMANDGGVICYGVAEDNQGHPTVLNPIPLTGQPERISSIARSAIAEPIEIEIKTFPKEDEPERGYLLVIVPASPRAPHMVIVKGEQRYYGRSAKGNIPLGEGEVARLYERRKEWERKRESLLEQVIRETPCQPHAEFGYLHLFASPLLRREDLVERVQGNQDDDDFMRELIRAALRTDISSQLLFDPDFRFRKLEKISSGWIVYMLSEPSRNFVREPERVLDLRVDFDGNARLFCGRVAASLTGELVILDHLIAGLTIRFLTLMGNLYEKAKYLGPADVGVAITGIKGAISSLARTSGFDSPTYQRTSRVSSTLLIGAPKKVAEDLLSRFFRAATGGQIDPLKAADAQ